MSYLLDGVEIRRPMKMEVGNSTQFAQNRDLDGGINRDYFGDNKRVWHLEYRNTTKAEFDIINTIYLSYLATNTLRTWQVTETNYTISQTSVHMDLVEREFSVGGADYISDFDVTLTEA